MDRRGQAERPIDAAPVAAGREAVPHFLLSHAPGEDEIFVRRFFNDLSDSVRDLLGIAADWPVGYLQMLDATTVSWSADEHTAVASCRTFVALYTPRYFLSRGCGKSWGIFAARLEAHLATTAERSAALIPVSWRGGGLPDPMPGPPWIGAPIAGEGGEDVAVLIRLQRHRARYRSIVRAVADQIIAAIRSSAPAPWPGQWSVAEDAFAALRPTLPSRSPSVRIVVVAGTRGQMAEVRANLEPYGERQEDWAPYRPNAAESAAARATSVAAQRELQSEVVAASGVIERLDRERSPNEIVVMLVDPWSTHLAHLLEVLRRLQEHDEAGATVVVAMSEGDPETMEHRRRLEAALEDVFSSPYGKRHLTLRAEPETAEEFDGDLAVALSEAEEWLLSASAGGPGRAAAVRPILRGP